jgi:hypothetical protein
MLAFRLHAGQGESDEVMNIFSKIIQNQHVGGEEILECFSVLAS